MEPLLDFAKGLAASFIASAGKEILESVGLQKGQKASQEAGVPQNKRPEQHRKYEDLLQALTALAFKHEKLHVEISSYVRGVRKQARTKIKMIEKAEGQLNEGKNISKFLAKIKATGNDPQEGFEELLKKYGALIDEVIDCFSEAVASYERNKRFADKVQQAASFTRYGAITVLGGIGIYQRSVLLAKFHIFALNPALMLAVISCSVAGGILVNWALGIPEELFREWAKEFKKLRVASNRINKALSERYTDLNEIRRLLGELKTPDTVNSINQDENSHSEDSNQGDGEDIDFLDSIKEACEEVEKKCHDFLDYMPLNNCVDFLPLGLECNITDKDKKDN